VIGRAVAGLIVALGLAADLAACSERAVPPGAAGFSCLGVPTAKCQELLADAQQSGPVAAMQIRCDAASCTTDSGSAAIIVVRANGGREEYGSAWSNAVGPAPDPVPTPPVTPVCLGVPQAWCDEMARNAMMNLGGRDPSEVASVMVRCRTACSSVKGDGDTTVTFRDGSVVSQNGWGYTSGP
jgi:hypothetical protein